MTKISTYYVLRLKNTEKYFEFEYTAHLNPLERFLANIDVNSIFLNEAAAIEYIEFLERMHNQTLRDKIEILKIEKTEIYNIISIDGFAPEQT